MALQPSGTMSIGGPTSGRSINLELGRSATATSSLNESALRDLAGVASGAISMSDFYGKSNSISLSVTGTATATINLGDGDFNYNATGPYVVTVSGSGEILVKAWGASGGGYTGTSLTGAGGYASGVLTVSDGDVFVVVVGAGGMTAPTYGSGNVVAPAGYGGGGGGGPYNAAGGGFSGIFETSSDPGITQGNARIMSGGGGGRYTTTQSAGGGGGTTGQGLPTSGGGGTQSAGGAVNSGGSGTAGTAGGVMTGGFGGFKAGGGGGGGYYGGGGADGGNSSGTQRAGGGGSGYMHPSVASPVLTQASSGTAANSSDPDWGGAGGGVATGTVVAPGTPGRVILRQN